MRSIDLLDVVELPSLVEKRLLFAQVMLSRRLAEAMYRQGLSGRAKMPACRADQN
jgi:hypothetical protein